MLSIQYFLSQTISRSIIAVMILPLFSFSVLAQDHYNALGRTASESTQALQDQLRDELPFEDARDFDEARRGFIATPDSDQILGLNGEVVWDMGDYDFLLNGQQYDSIHPSLQRIATLNMNWGLFEVVPNFLYQVRGFDLANMTLIMGDSGWIIFDVLASTETAAAALDLANEHLGSRPVKAVIYSHSHGDHYMGILGVTSEEEVANGEVQIIAPRGFLEESIAESLFASGGNRGQYTGVPSPFGRVDSAIGKALSLGQREMIAPTLEILGDYEEHVVDGVRMIFQNTPGTEAPAEMNTWLPDQNVFWAAENVTATIHNIYTPRGTLVRDALMWSKKINEALYRYGQDAEVMVSSHNWPRWGNERIQEVLRTQRDAYANLHNGVLFLVNQGTTINEIHNEYEVPNSLRQEWSARQYHGSEFHNSRAIINRYLGYWDGNPATLVPLSPADSAPLYVEMMGGATSILLRAQTLFDSGDYRLGMEILNKLVYAEPANSDAKRLLASTYEQLAYQYESSSLRNIFVSAAQALREEPSRTGELVIGSGGPSLNLSRAHSISTEQWLDLLGSYVDSRQADGMAFSINLYLTDTDERFVIEMSHATLSSIKGYALPEPDIALTLTRDDLNAVIMGQTSLYQLLQNGIGNAQGDLSVLQRLETVLATFPSGVEVVPGTRFRN